MNLGVLCATLWEIKSFVLEQNMVRSDPKTFLLDRPGMNVIVRISGIGPENARRACENMANRFSKGVLDAVISTGFACGLKTEIKAGDMAVDLGRSALHLSEKLDRISDRMEVPLHKGVFWCANRPLMTASDKLAIAQKSGAIAGEMESQSVYEFCKGRGIPFCSFRAVSDTLGQDLPSSALTLNSDGTTGLRFWSALISRPGEWPDFLRLAAGARRAERCLRRALTLFLKEMEP